MRDVAHLSKKKEKEEHCPLCSQKHCQQMKLKLYSKTVLQAEMEVCTEQEIKKAKARQECRTSFPRTLSHPRVQRDSYGNNYTVSL